MRLKKLTLREIHLRLVSPFETSFGKTDLRRIVLVEAEIDGISGWGESTAGENPYYCYETVETSWHILRDHLWPIMQGREVSSASEVSDLLDRVRGHNMAKAALETAFWDAEAKLKNLPLAKLLGGTREEIPCGVSIGIQPSLPDLIAKVEKELAAGYQRIKIKIKPGQDVEPVRALRERFPQIRLMVDANSAYRQFLAARRELLATAMTSLLDEYCPSWLRDAVIRSADPLAGSELDLTVYQSDWDTSRIVATAVHFGTKWASTIALPDLESAINAAAGGLASDVIIGLENVPVQVTEDKIQILIGPFDVTGTAEEWLKVLERERADFYPLSQCPTVDLQPWTGEHVQFPVTSID